MTDAAAAALAGFVALSATLLLGVLAALLERSGPIRLRQWAEEAGQGLKKLYANLPRFEAFRFWISLLGRVAAVGFFAALLLLFVSLELPWTEALGWSSAAVCLLLALLELSNRYLVGRDPETSLRRLTRLLQAMHVLLRPLLPLVAPFLPRPEEEDEGELEEATREEIEAYIDVGRREGILEDEEGELVRGLVSFGDTYVRSVMTPRIDMVCASVDTSLEELVQLVLRSGHSRIPLYQGSIDEIVGIIHVRDLLRVVTGKTEGTLRSFLQPTHFVPETKSLAQLLRELQERRQELAVVVDEYGGTEGLVTIEDLLEEIFGEIADEHDRLEPEMVQLPDGSWRLDGRMHLEDLEELIGHPLADVENAPYETVGGLVFGVLGHVPKVGEKVEAYGLRFLVETADQRRARRVRVEVVKDDEGEVAAVD